LTGAIPSQFAGITNGQNAISGGEIAFLTLDA
jgi:hypothetical protein